MNNPPRNGLRVTDASACNLVYTHALYILSGAKLRVSMSTRHPVRIDRVDLEQMKEKDS